MSKSHFVGVQGRGLIALPADLRRRHHLDQPGAQVQLIERDDGVIELHPHVAIPADQAWFWTPEWQAGEREVDKHVAHGDIEVFNGSEDFLKHIQDVWQAAHPDQ